MENKFDVISVVSVEAPRLQLFDIVDQGLQLRLAMLQFFCKVDTSSLNEPVVRWRSEGGTVFSRICLWVS